MDSKARMLLFAGLVALAGCQDDINPPDVPGENEYKEDPGSFSEIGQIDIGDAGAAEISTFDPATKRLFVVNNSDVNQIDVIDMQDPSAMAVIHSISMAPYGGKVNSTSVSGGTLAAAIESLDKQTDGKVAVFNTSDYSEVKVVTVGALPDMVIFSPDGKYILTANEGEPGADYTNDPPGSVSIISVEEDYAVSTLDFSGFAADEAGLEAAGFRVFGPSGDFAADIEPEYISVSNNSKTAWVTLQENNAIARIDLASGALTDLFPLGFKDYNAPGNEIDVSNEDGKVELRNWNVKGVYMPDAIAVIDAGGVPYLFSVNEGDAREYDAFEEAERVKNVDLDPVAFPDAGSLQEDEMLGRLNITTTLGDKDSDGDFDELYSFGARSFSVWNGNDGTQIYDSGNELDRIAIDAGYYDDDRSDDKSIEPEGIATGVVGQTPLVFVGMERIDAVAVYDVSDPASPEFLQVLQTGDAPEGLTMISAGDSPVERSLLVVSSEDDGVIKVFAPDQL